MKTGRFSESQIIGILKQQEAGMKTGDICREHGKAKPRSTTGNPNRAVWKRRTSNAYATWSRRMRV